MKKLSINNISIKKKLFFITIVGAVLPLFLLLSVFSYQMYEEIKKNHQDVVDLLIEKVSFNLNQALNDIQDINYDYIMDSNLDVALLDENTSYFQSLEFKIQTDVFSRELINQINIFYENEDIDYIGKSILPLEDEKNTDWYQFFSQTPQYLVLNSEINDGDVTFSMIKSLNRSNFFTKNLIKVDFLGDELINVLNDPLFDELKGQVYLINSKNQIVASNKLIYKHGENAFKPLNESELEKNNSIYSTSVNDEFYTKGWTLVFLMDNNVVVQKFSEKMAFLVLSASAIIAVLLLMSLYVSNSISKRLLIINEKMNHMDDNNFATISGKLGQDEIGQTANHFDEMVLRIKTLLFELKTER